MFHLSTSITVILLKTIVLKINYYKKKIASVLAIFQVFDA